MRPAQIFRSSSLENPANVASLVKGNQYFLGVCRTADVLVGVANRDRRGRRRYKPLLKINDFMH